MVFFVKFFHLKVIDNVCHDVSVIVYSSAVHHVHPFLRAEWTCFKLECQCQKYSSTRNMILIVNLDLVR